LNPERVRKGRARAVPIEYGDTTSASVLRHAGVERARAAVVLLSDPRATRRTLSLCRSLAPGIFLLARTRYLAEIPERSAPGAEFVLQANDRLLLLGTDAALEKSLEVLKGIESSSH